MVECGGVARRCALRAVRLCCLLMGVCSCADAHAAGAASSPAHAVGTDAAVSAGASAGGAAGAPSAAVSSSTASAVHQDAGLPPESGSAADSGSDAACGMNDAVQAQVIGGDCATRLPTACSTQPGGEMPLLDILASTAAGCGVLLNENNLDVA